MGQELQVPSSFQNRGMAKAFQGRVDIDDNLADGIAQGYPIVAYKGKIWAVRYRGERKIVTRKDDGTPSGHLDVVILRQAKGKSKSYYKKYDAATSEGDRPICASMDGITPDIDVQEKQCDSCAICPRNVWKTNPETNRRERDCTDYKRLAVLPMPYHTEPLYGAPLMEPMFLRVPPDSLNALALMGDTMSKQGYHYSTYLTRITFDPQKAHPSMLFRPVQPLGDDEAGAVIELQGHASIPRITGEEAQAAGPREIPTAPVNSMLPKPAAVTGAVTIEGSATSGLGLAPAKTVTEPAPDPAPAAAEPKKRGRKPAAANGGNGHAEQTAKPADPDTGNVEASDDELDNEIANLIKA